MQLENIRHILEKYVSNFTKICPMGGELIHSDMAKLTVAFHNFEKEFKRAYDFFAYRLKVFGFCFSQNAAVFFGIL